MMKHWYPVLWLIFGLFMLVPYLGFAQNTTKQIGAKFITEEVVLDGKLDEAFWEMAETGSDFVQYFPTDSLPAKHATSFKVVFSETTLYLGVRAEAANGDYVVSSLRRDFGGNYQR